MRRKILVFTVILAMLLQPAASFAEDKKEELNPYDYKVDDVTYYEINNGKKLQKYDMDTLVKQAIYNKPEGQRYSVAEYWAALATGILASDGFFYHSQNNDGFELRFFANPSQNPKNYSYANLQKLLSTSDQSRKEMFNEKIKDNKRWGDVFTISYGMQKANSLSEVIDTLCSRQREVNGSSSGNFEASDFKEWNAKGIENLNVKGPIYYNYMASRDAWGGSWGFCYNDVAILYSDFELYYAAGKNGEGAQMPVDINKDNTWNDVLDEMKKTGKKIDGLAQKSGTDIDVQRTDNKGTSEVNQEFMKQKSVEESLVSTVEEAKGFNWSAGQHIEAQIGKDSDMFRLNVGLDWSEETTTTTTKGDSVGKTAVNTVSSTTSVSVPPHTSVQQTTQTNTDTATMDYKTPAGIKYKVTIIAFNGNYYDDGIWTYHRNDPCRTLVTQFGGNMMTACEDLLYFSENNGRNSLTRAWEYKKTSWGSPTLTTLNLGAVKNNMDNYGKKYGNPQYDETIKALTTRQPYSLFGAQLERVGTTTVNTIGEEIPLYALEKVEIEKESIEEFINDEDNAEEDEETDNDKNNKLEPLKITINVGDKIELSKIRLAGIDAKDWNFHGFNAKYGKWKLVDKKGNVLVDDKGVEKTENGVASLKKDVVKGLKKGEATIKYFVTDKKYHYLGTDDKGKDVPVPIEQKDVDTQSIIITVEDPSEEENDETNDANSVEAPDAANSADEPDASNDAAANDANGADDTNSIDEPDASNSADEPDASNDANDAEATDAEEAVEEEAAEEPAVDISQEEREEILSSLSCDPKYCSMAHAALFVKNHIGAQSTANEQIYTRALLQLAADELDSNSQQTQMETDAVIWAMQEGLMGHIDRNTAYSGITELEFAQLAYKTAVKYGESVSCDDVIGDYSGSEALSADEKKAMNWAISKGILSEKEESSKILDPGRPMTSAEAAAFCK